MALLPLPLEKLIHSLGRLPGIGPKTAQKLIAEYGSIDGLYENIDKLKGKQKENLIEFEKQVRLSRELATIIQKVPIKFDLNQLSCDTILARLISISVNKFFHFIC